MDTFPVTRPRRKPELFLAPEPAVGGLGRTQKHARPPVCIQAKGVASAPAGCQQERRKKSAPLPGFRTGTRAKRLVCPHEICERRCTDSAHLKQRLRVHVGGKSYVCPWGTCGYACGRPCHLKQHLRVHSGEKPFVCPWGNCGYASGRSDRLKQHLRFHSGEKPFVCPWENCGYASGRSDHLKQHLRFHSGEKPFVCPWENCGYATGRSELLTRHWRVHSGEKPFDCPWEGCGYAFALSSNLKVHLRTHSGVKPFICPHEGCGVSFAHISTVKNHLRVHSGEKPFACSHEGCGRVFAQVATLRSHLRIHAGKKPFGCFYEGCKHAFVRSSTLRRHLRVHSNEKPFECPWQGCGHASARAANLRLHLRVHSGERHFVGSHAGGGYACGRSGSLARFLHRSAKGAGVVRVRKDSTRGYRSSGARSGHTRTRAKSASCSQNLEAGQQLPVTTPYPPSTFSTTAAARLNVGADLNLATVRQRQSTAVFSDSPGAIATVSSGICEDFDRGLAPSDGHELRSPGLNLSPAPSPPAAQFEWEQSLSATGGMSDWVPWSTDHNLFEDWAALCSSSVSGLELGSSALTDDDKAFWRALLSPAHGAQ